MIVNILLAFFYVTLISMSNHVDLLKIYIIELEFRPQ